MTAPISDSSRDRKAIKETLNVFSLYRRSLIFTAMLAGILMLGISPAGANASAAKWRIEVSSQPTRFSPAGGNSFGLPEYAIVLRNVGDAHAGSFTVTDNLPAGILDAETGLSTVTLTPNDFQGDPSLNFSELAPNTQISSRIPVEVTGLGSGSFVTNTVTVSGGAPDAEATATTLISSTPAPFELSPIEFGFNNSEGEPVGQAGSHPDQVTLAAEFPTFPTGTGEGRGALAASGGGVHDFKIAFPKGLVINPTASPVRCQASALNSSTPATDGCPVASQVGMVDVLTTLAGDNFVNPNPTPLYSMIPPPGVPAEFGFNLTGLQVDGFIAGGLRGGDYTLTSESDDIFSRPGNPVIGIRAVLWGNPSSPRYDNLRGPCGELAGFTGPCPTSRLKQPFLTLPSYCGQVPSLELSADSWNSRGAFLSKNVPATAADGEPIQVMGCEALHFSPTLRARPTTEVSESPSGLEVDLGIPQHEELETLATPTLRKAEVTLPEGLVVNPSSANGLAGCSSSQVGVNPNTGVADGAPPTCPDASRIGTAELETPLLEKPLPGSIYIATPNDNPFNSLLAIYIVIDDPSTGVLVKLSGHVIPDPQNGRLTTIFDNNPQLPFSDLKLNFKGGPQGVLRTPATCGSYATTSVLTPWSAPESGPPATPQDDYAISDNCFPAANSPEFEAGTVSPTAGKYTPFNIHLSRKDGTQQFKTLTLTPPPGLTAKLAGTPPCSDEALAAAAGKSGHDEQANPSCPADSQIGDVTVGAGAGPAPYYAKAKAYLAGPYKGAPLSMAIITPAVAGPYDLGTVVTKVALHVNPATTQITADADPIPAILQGIPLDVRSVDVSLDKPGFSRTGTSCDPFSVNGRLVSTLGQSVALKSRYQLANCANLAFKPKLAIRLKGGTKRGQNPALIATLSAKDGEANIASTAVTLPHSAFLDQSHIKTVCTRVQFAAGAGNGAECPAGSIYGEASAKSPLLDYTLTGNAYLRSSSHKLPDL